jgi:2,5-dihydroxypyridine 5,6-dioxygenase
MLSFPLTTAAAAELVPLFRSVLACCALQPQERVLIHTDSAFNPHYPAACLSAALGLGAEALILTVPASRPEGDSPFLLRAWKDADLVVDMVSTGAHAYSSTLNQAVESGTRILRVAEPLDCLRQLLPDRVIRGQSRAYARLLTQASEISITSASGTDLRVGKVGRPGAAYYGMADEPGRWDHWPSGLVACAPNEGSAEGVLVIEPGDILLTWGQMVSAPIRCEFSGGRVRSIVGGAEAERLRSALDAFQDVRSRVLGIVGWGLCPKARWHRILDRRLEAGGIMDTETYMGNLLLVLGSNTSVSLRGQNATPAHVNINCRGQSIYLDNQPVVEAGRLVQGEPC